MADAMTLDALVPMTQAEARQKTEGAKERADEIWLALLEIYRRQGHVALGYGSWGAYWTAEFGGHASRGYQLLDAARVVEIVTAEDEPTVLPRSNGAQSSMPAGDSRSSASKKSQAPKLPPPSNEKVARKLTATAKEDPKRARQVWKDAVAKFGADATPEQVAQVAAGNGHPPESEPPVDFVKEAKRCASAISKAARKQDAQAAKQALAIWRATVYPGLDRIAREG